MNHLWFMYTQFFQRELANLFSGDKVKGLLILMKLLYKVHDN